MQKKLIAMAVAAISAAPAFAADSSVTIYGLVDGGLTYRTGNYNNAVGSRFGIDEGIGNGSRLGVRGSEQIGDVKGLFVLEAGIATDTGASRQGSTAVANRTWGRQTYVGLEFQNVGQVTLGRQFTNLYDMYASVDPFGLGNVGQQNNIFTHVTSRYDNAVKFKSAWWGGVFGVDAIYSTNIDGSEVTLPDGTPQTDVRAWQLYPRVKFGLATFTFGYQEQKKREQDLKNKSFDAGLVLNFSALTVDGGYSRLNYEANKQAGAAKHDRVLLGVNVPLGNFTLRGSYNVSKARTDDGTPEAKAQQVAIGARYALSKRTDFYTTYSAIFTNDAADAAAYYTVGDASGAGLGYKRAFDLGIRHVF